MLIWALSFISYLLPADSLPEWYQNAEIDKKRSEWQLRRMLYGSNRNL